MGIEWGHLPPKTPVLGCPGDRFEALWWAVGIAGPGHLQGVGSGDRYAGPENGRIIAHMAHQRPLRALSIPQGQGWFEIGRPWNHFLMLWLWHLLQQVSGVHDLSVLSACHQCSDLSGGQLQIIDRDIVDVAIPISRTIPSAMVANVKTTHLFERFASGEGHFIAQLTLVIVLAVFLGGIPDHGDVNPLSLGNGWSAGITDGSMRSRLKPPLGVVPPFFFPHPKGQGIPWCGLPDKRACIRPIATQILVPIPGDDGEHVAVANAKEWVANRDKGFLPGSPAAV